MNALRTLPRFTPTAAGARPAMVASLHAPSPAARALAARRLACAVRHGRASAHEVQQAAARGDAGVADLLRRLARLPPRPRVTAAAFDLRAVSEPPAPALRDGLARLIRLLGESGDLLASECRALAAVSLPYKGFIATLNRAWNRRCHRLVAPLARAIAPALPDGALPSSGFFVMPGVLLEAVRRSPHAPSIALHGEPDAIPDVFIEASGTMVAQAPVSVQDHEAHAALCAAWDELSRALSFPLMAASTDGISMLVGYADEMLSDAALRCAWIGDQPQIDDEALEELGQEIGFGADSPEALDDLRAYLRYCRDAGRRPRWTVASRAMRQWRKTHAGSPTAIKVDALLALARLLRRAPAFDRDHAVADYSDEGILPLNLMPQGTGLDDYFRYIVDQEWQQGSCAHVALTRSPDAPGLDVAALLDRCVLEAAAVSAASAALDPGFRRSAPEPHSGFDDE